MYIYISIDILYSHNFNGFTGTVYIHALHTISL